MIRLPGRLLDHSTLPLFLSRHRKLGAFGAGTRRWARSTPLEVIRKSRSPTISGEQVARLCGETPSFAIMSSVHSSLPAVSAQTTVQRLLTYQILSPSTTGLEQMPSSGQSYARPPSSLSYTICHWKAPSDSRKHMTMPLSPWIFLSRGLL